MPFALTDIFPIYSSQTGAFATALPFTSPQATLAQHTVAAPIAFTLNTAGAVAGYETMVRLVANGVNTPTFSSVFKNVAGAYDNRAGIVNYLSFKLISTTEVVYTVAQEYVAPPVVVPGAPVLLLSEGAGSNVITLVYDQTLDALSIPATSAFTLSTGTVSSIAITGHEVRITTAAATAPGVALTYTQPGTNRLQNSSGLLAPAFTARTIETGPVPLTFATRAGSITVDGTNNYLITSPGFGTTHMLADPKILANTDGWVSFDYVSATQNRNIILGFDSADTNKAYNIGGGYDRLVYISGTGAIQPGTDGAFLNAVSATLALNDTLRLRRASGTITLERNNQGNLWEVLYTWAGTYNGDIFINANFGANSTVFNRPRIKGGVAK
jgi:hypothetical protein